MAFCINCGKQVAEGVKFCPSCGASMATPVAEAAPQRPVVPPMQQQAAQQPIQQPITVQQPIQQPLYAPPAAAPVYKEEPISTGGYIGIFLLLMIPIVNLICLLIWACGGCSKRNKTNLSRALLVWMLISAVLGGLIFLAGGLLFGDQIDALKEFGSQMGTMK